VEQEGAMTAGERPQVHSNADTLGDGRLSAPSALRNVGPISAAMKAFLPDKGRALEIASGTGQHVVVYAQSFPEIIWQPTDIAAERLASIDAWAAADGGENLLPARRLDASGPGWHIGDFNFVNIGNLFHLISHDAAQNVIDGASRSLVAGGVFFVYGPFRTEGEFRSAGDESFHGRIMAEDPAAGYKDVEWMKEIARSAGLIPEAQLEMPANNLCLVWRK